jgi:hypothetical protein
MPDSVGPTITKAVSGWGSWGRDGTPTNPKINKIMHHHGCRPDHLPPPPPRNHINEKLANYYKCIQISCFLCSTSRLFVIRPFRQQFKYNILSNCKSISGPAGEAYLRKLLHERSKFVHYEFFQGKHGPPRFIMYVREEYW